tara:strand:+ start:1738 stop:2022 length:285 start_codon:yes stop_codon:yes gene_type:complete
VKRTDNFAIRSSRQRGRFDGSAQLVLLAMLCALLLPGCRTLATTTESDPHCPRWNIEEWKSFSVLIDEVDAETAPAVFAMGTLLLYCFPEAFEP